ncbi:sigma-54 interaction domain-containing protein [Brevibacillus sp. B_LB10_24]|uniref:sigma-54 interaction domain-containing protein n=1 Tax=Brevibacillus sp. B_LB10_24 TaxID=3380645 RepID=UPI0038BA03FD
MLHFPSLDAAEAFPLDRQLEWLKAIVYSVNDGILVIDKQEVVRLINPEYTQITGVPPERIIGKKLRDVRPGALLPKTLADGKNRVGIYRKEGSREYVVDMAPIMVRGEIIGAVSVCKGLTEVHTLAQELAKSKETISRLEKTMGSLHQAAHTFDQIVGNDGGLKDIVFVARRAADSDLPVLITGESGTGKELFAQAIHNESKRAGNPFVPVNCATFSPELLESELFGYEDGAFTHAKKGGKIGLFEFADQGTLFLDEIGDMSFALQAKLLRVLQEQKIRRVGATRERAVNVRVIAATNKDLTSLVAKKQFREDLLYRLNVISLKIPPLRERRQDIPRMIDWMLSRNGNKSDAGTTFSIEEGALRTLQNYDWPGNVRELKNAIDYAVCMTDDAVIKAHHLPEWIAKTSHPESCQPQVQATLKEAMDAAQRNAILQAIEQCGKDVEGKKKAARLLGISLATLYNKMKQLDIMM